MQKVNNTKLLKYPGKLKKAVFFDRDGTLVSGFPDRPANCVSEVKLLNGMIKPLKELRDAGFLLVIVTNQGGIGNGKMTNQEFKAMCAALDDLMSVGGGPRFDAHYWCAHKPKAGCRCRKPEPQLLIEASSEMGIDLGKSYMVGNAETDMLAGRAAGVNACLGLGNVPNSDAQFPSMAQIAAAILILDDEKCRKKS